MFARLKRHGDPLGGRIQVGVSTKFYRESVATYEGEECLIWPLARDRKGYAVMYLDGVRRMVFSSSATEQACPRSGQRVVQAQSLSWHRAGVCR